MKAELAAQTGGDAPHSLIEKAFRLLNRGAMVISITALIGAALILTESVFVRYFLKQTTDWQDEVSVMLLVGATFLSASYVQSQRGHIGIEALDGVLPPAVNRVRKVLVDVVSLAFCSFFSWKSWTLMQEARLGGETTSSTFGSPLWIPYSIMALGMTMLSLQILLQLVRGHKS